MIQWQRMINILKDNIRRRKYRTTELNHFLFEMDRKSIEEHSSIDNIPVGKSTESQLLNLH